MWICDADAFSQALFTFYGGIVLDGVYWGTGMHMEDLTVQQRVNGMKV
jgi:hypothetical protein